VCVCVCARARALRLWRIGREEKRAAHVHFISICAARGGREACSTYAHVVCVSRYIYIYSTRKKKNPFVHATMAAGHKKKNATQVICAPRVCVLLN
jgi:hypothetical protein